MITPFNDPIAHSMEEYQTFLRSQGFEPVAKAAFGSQSRGSFSTDWLELHLARSREITLSLPSLDNFWFAHRRMPDGDGQTARSSDGYKSLKAVLSRATLPP